MLAHSKLNTIKHIDYLSKPIVAGSILYSFSHTALAIVTIPEEIPTIIRLKATTIRNKHNQPGASYFKNNAEMQISIRMLKSIIAISIYSIP
jgi:hypothetical protein